MRLEINPHIRALRTAFRGELVAADFSRPVGLHRSTATAPGEPLLFEYDLGALSRGPLLPPHVSAHGPGPWRYASLLPVAGVNDAYAADVGQTPTIEQRAIGAELGIALFLKNEAHNPSGSFKDRGLAVAVALGVACGAERVCLPTQGNAGVAAAMFSARAGLPGAIVYMPEAHVDSRYHRAASAFGAEVRFHGRHLGEAGARMRADLERELATGRCLDVSTFVEPGRVEGKKTMGFEIAEYFGEGLPDYIVYPTGGGTGLIGIWKAFDELRGLGVIAADARLPRMIAVQAERCAPIVAAFEHGADDVAPVTSQGTAAHGLDVPATRMGAPLLRVLRSSEGRAIAVGEEAMAAAQRRLGAAGVSAGLEGAATLAATRALVERGAIAGGSRVLLLITSGL